MQKFLKKGIAIITFVSLIIQTCGGASALELKILDPKIEGSFPDWGNLGEVTDINKTYSDLVTDKIRAVQEQNDIGVNDSISEKEKEEIMENIGKASEETLSVPIEEVDTKWKKRMLVDGLENVDEKIIEGLKKSQIIDTFIDSESQQEIIANPTLEDDGENLTTKATEAEISLGKNAELEKKITFSTVADGEEKWHEVSYRPLSVNNVQANIIENKAIYEDIWDGADAVLTAQADGFKEDIILKDKSKTTNIRNSGYQGDGNWVFYYDLNLSGLTAKLDNNQVVYFDENNMEMARVTMPVVIDNIGEVSSRAYWDLISKEKYENGYTIDEQKFGQEEVSEEVDLSRGAEAEHNTSETSETDLTNTFESENNDLTGAANVQSNSVWKETWQSVEKWWKSIFGIFGSGKAQQSDEENDLSDAAWMDQTTVVTPIEQIGLMDQTEKELEESSEEKNILVLVVDTTNLTYPIDVDPTTYILTQSDMYNTANGKLSSNNVNDVKVYDTTKEPTSNYSYNKEIKSTLAFNNTAGEFDLSATNRLAHWSFDDNNGTTAEDDVTPAANASLINNPGWTAGEIGRALNFDGNDDYLQINDDDKLSFGSSNSTISVWIYPENLSAEQGILGKGSSGEWEYYLGTTVNGGLQYIAWQLNGNEYFSITTPTKILKANEWSQIVITNNDGNEAILWINGKMIKKTSTFAGSMGNGTSDLNIGRANNDGTINYFTGKIDNVSFYDEYLSEGQIHNLYNNGLSKLVGLWTLDGMLSDYSGYNNELTNNGATFEDNGRKNQAMNFDGADWLNAGNSASLSFVSGFSVESWVKIPPNGTNQKIVEKNDEYSLNVCPDGRPVLMIKTNHGWSSTAGTGNSCIDSTAPVITDNTWHNLLGTYDGKILRLYVDGKQVAYYYAPGTITKTNNDLLIGQNLTGSIDEMTIYARPLSADEAELHYGLGYQASVSTIINLDNTIGYAEYSQLAFDNIQVEQTGVLQIKGIGRNGEAISEKIKLRKGNLQRVLSSNRYKSITELTALNEDGNTSEKSLKISAGKILAFSPFHDANWRNGITKANDQVTGLWNFDEGEGNVSEDNSGSNNTAYLAGGISNNNWLYERNIDISPATSIDDYQLKIEFNTDNFDYIKAKEDGRDIRFFNTNGVELSYWIENWDTSGSSSVWVKIPNSGTATIKMKYGNAAADDKSDGERVFDFFDDFSGDTIDNDKWSVYDNGGYLSQDDKLIASGGSGAWGSNGLTSKTTFVRNNNYELNLDYKSISGTQAMFGWHDSGTGTSYTDLIYAYYDNSNSIYVYEDGNNRGAQTGSWNSNWNYKIKMPLKATGATYKRSVNQGEIYETNYDSVYSSETPLKLGIANYNRAFEIDNLFVRRVPAVESTGSLGGMILTSESLSGQPNWMDSNWGYRTILHVDNTNNNEVLTNFQIPININSKLLVEASHLQADGDDIRFTDSDGTSSLNYWLESGINTNVTKLWVKLPTIEAKSIRTIYVYYGNAAAAGASNFDNVFTKDYEESGLAGLWHIDEGSGTTLTDSSGNNNSGNLVNSPTWQATDGGQWGNQAGTIFATGSHLLFNGSNNVVQINDNTTLKPSTEITLSAWFNTNDKTLQQKIVSKTESGSYQLSINENSTCPSNTLCFLANVAGTYRYATIPTSYLNSNQWYFVTGTYDGSLMKLYLNGSRIAETSVSGTLSHSTTPFCIGGESRAGDCLGGQYFNGYIDEVRIYDRALTALDIRSYFNRRKSYYNAPNVSIDNTLPASSLPDWDENGKYGKAISFDGQDDFVQIPNDDSISPTNQMTVGAWIKPMALNGWLYTKAINMYPPTAYDDYQVKVTLNNSNFDYTKAKPDASDLRFSDSRGNQLKYWVENWDQHGASSVWVKVAKSGTNKIFMYYGNNEAVGETNFDNVFTKEFGESNVVGLWHADEGSGTTTADNSGYGHTATLNNSPSWQGTDGGQWSGREDIKFASGSHLNFNGSNQYLSVSDSTDWEFGTGDFSLDFWLNIPANATSQTVIGNRQSGCADNGWNLEFYSTANRLEWHTCNTVVGNSSSLIQTGKWNHITVVRTSGVMKFYINGVLANTFNNAYNYSTAGGSLYIGKDGSNSTGQLNGYLDEIRVIKGRALSLQEIQTQYERRLFVNNEPTISVAVENTPPPSTNLYTRTISLSAPTSESDYVAKLELTPSNYDYSRSRPDGGDLRFVDNEGNNLNYYIQNWNIGGTSTVFIKIPSSGTSSIVMYYGDKTLVNLSNCADTMTLCDDFADGQFDNDKWSKVRLEDSDWNEGVTESSWFMLKALNGKNLGDGNNTAPMILSNDLGNIDYELTARLKFNPAPSENKQQAGLVIYSDDNNYLLADIGNIDGGKANLAVEDDASMVAFGDIWTIPTISDLKIVKNGNSYKFYYKDANSSSWIQHSSEIVAEMNRQQIGFTALADAGSTISSYFDSIEVKKISSESNLTLGTEQSWTYKRNVNLSPLVPDDDWQVRVDLTSSNFDYGHAKSDGSDLRFFTIDGEKLNYWIEKWNDSGNSIVWVKIPEVGTSEMLMYYGNNNALNESDGEKIFEFFDNFDNGVIDSVKWTNTTGFTESGGYLTGGNTTNSIRSTNIFSGNKILETRHLVSTEATNGHMVAGWFNSTSDSYGLLLAPTNTWYIRSDSAWSGSNSFTYINQWIKSQVTAAGTNSKVRLYRESDGVYSNQITYSNTGLSNEPITLGKRYDNANAGQTYAANWDWIFVRKYSDSAEPVSTLSEEERWLYRKNITLTPATPLADYQVKIELNGGNFDYGAARDDGGDIRFFDTNGSVLNYWVEKWDKNGTSVIWVKIPTIATSTIQIMYGNQTAESQSNGENTFDFFDDFDDHALDTNKWNWTRESAGDWSEGYDRPDQLSITALSGKNMWGSDNSAPILLENNTSFPVATDFELMVATETDLTQNYQQAGLIVYESDLTHVQVMRGYNDGAKVTFKYEADNSVVAAVDENQTSNYTDLKVRKSGNDYTMYYKNIENASWTQHGTNISAVINNPKVGLTSYADIGPDTNTFFDNIRLRKYSVNDPVATIGAQQEASAVITNNIVNKGSQFSLGATDEKIFATLGSQTIDGVIDTDWNHVVLTYDGETQKLFVNGELKQSLEYDLPTWPLDVSDIVVGDQYYGSIDDLLISKKAMSETEVKDWYESGVAYEKKQPTENQLLNESQVSTITSGLIGRWNMNETMGLGVNDSSGHNHHGSAVNAKIVEGKEGKARNFVADNDYISIPDSAEFNMSGDYSMSAWINPDNIATNDRGIMGTYTGSSNGFIFALGSSTAGNPTLNFWSNGIWNEGPAITMDGTWKHVVFTKQNNVGTFYVDSEAKSVGTAYQINDGGSLQIGASGTSWSSYRFDGRVDDARIYNRALTPTEIYKLAHEFDPRWTTEEISSQANNIKISGNQENPQHEVAIKIITPGPVGIATYKSSIDGGMTWSEATYATALGTSTIRRDYTNTGIDIDWEFGTDFGAGDVFDIASWYTEPKSSSRGISRTFPEVANLVATDKSVEILDQADNSLWMRFTNTADSGYLGGSTTNIQSVDMAYGHLVAGSNTTSDSIGLLDVDFVNERARYYRNNTLPEILTGNIMNRNFGNELLDDNNQILNNTVVNDVAAKMIKNNVVIVAATAGGLNIVDNNKRQVFYGTHGTDSINKIALGNNGNAVLNMNGDANIVLALENITNYQNSFDLENRNESYLGTTTSGWSADYQLSNDADTGTVNDLAINDHNWLADEASSQILIGTDAGASLIDTMSNNINNDPVNNRHDGFIKQIGNQYITEGMNGAGLIKGMWLEGDQTKAAVSDRSQEGNDLTVHGFLGNGTLTNNDWVAGVRGKSLNFDGNNDYLAVNDNPDFDFTNNDTLSFGAWIKPKASAEKYVLAQTDGSASGTSFSLKTIASGTGINFQSNVGFGSDLYQVNSKEYPLDVWHYVTGVLDGSNQVLSLYVDGQLEEDATTPANINNSSEPVTIGWAEGASKYFSGNISGVFLTNNALSKNQINKMYQVGLGALNDNADDLNRLGGTSNDVRAVALDYDNYRAFFGTANGLSEIDLLKDSRTQYWNLGSSPALPNNYVKTISYGSNRILAGTNSGAVSIRTDGSYTSSDTLGKLQSGKGRDVFTDGAYNYYVSDKGLDIVKLSDMSRKGYVTREEGFNSVVAFGGKVYMGSEVGVWKADIANVVDEYDLTSPAYTNMTVPQLISNNVNDIHGRTIGGKQYLVVGTDNGAQLIGDIYGEIKYTVFRNNENDNITKVWLNEDGDLAYYNATDKTVCIYTNAIDAELYYMQLGASSYTRRYDLSTTPRLIDNAVNDLVYIANTSTAQSGGNTLYVGTESGTTVINEHSTMASSTVKHLVSKATNDARTGILLPLTDNDLAPEKYDNVLYNSINQFDSTREKYSFGNDPDLAAFWDFDQTMPGGVTDRSGKNNNGYFGSDTGLAGGKIGQGLYLNGNGSYLIANDDISLHPTSAFTWEGWVWKDPAVSNRQAEEPILASKYDSGNNGEFILYYNKNNKLQLRVADGSSNVLSNESSSVSPLNWHHVAATFESGVVKFYIDGVLDMIQTLSVTNLAKPPYNNNPTAMSDMYLGNDWQLTKGAFAGYLDEVAYFTRALTFEEIQNHFSLVESGENGTTVNNQDTLAYPTAGLVTTANNAQELMNLNFDENLADSHGSTPTTMIETSFQRPTLNQITYGGNTNNNIVLDLGASGSWDESFVSSPRVIKDGNIYKMWYTGGDSTNKYRIGYATSSDGIVWSKYAGNSCAGTSGNGCVLDVSAGKFDSNYAYSADVQKDGNVYKMWYTGYNGSSYNIGYATSSDGINWTKQNSGNPIMTTGSAGSWDDLFVGYPTVLKEGSLYKMWFSGEQLAYNFRIGYATSTDGLTWTKYDDPNEASCGFSESNDDGCMIGLGDAGAFDEADLESPSVIKHNDEYYLYYFGRTNSGTSRLGVFESKNALDWIKANDNSFIMDLGSGWDSTYLDSPFVLTEGNELKMYYSGSGAASSRIGLATMDFDPGRFGKSLYIGNNDQYIYPLNNKINRRAGTIGFWAKLDNVGDGLHEVFNIFDEENDNQDGLYLALQNNQISVGLNGVENILAGKADMTNNYWNHVALSWEKPSANNKNLKLYFNGLLIDSVAFTEPISSGYDSIQLGGNPAENRDYLKGNLDDFRIYNQALGEDGIYELYTGSLGNVGKINLDHDSNSATANPLSEGTIEFMYTPDWSSNGDNNVRVMIDSLGGDSTKYGSQYLDSQTAFNRLRIWKDEGTETNTADRLHFGILDNDGDLYEIYTNETIDFAQGTSYKIAVMWDLDNNDLTTGGNNIMRLIVDNAVVAGDNFTTGITANKKKNGADTSNTEPIIVNAVPEKFYLGSGKPNTQTNLLANSSFEEKTGSDPSDWNKTGAINFDQTGSDSKFASSAVSITGPDTTNKISQTISGVIPGIYTLSWWSKGGSATNTQKVYVSYPSSNLTVNNDPGTNYVYNQTTFTTTATGNVTIDLSADSGETVWYDGLTLVKSRLDENYQTTSSIYSDFKTTNFLMSQEELNAETLAQTYNTTNKNASLAGETNNTEAIAVKKVNSNPTAADDILFVGTKGYYSEGAVTQITFGTTDQRTNEYRQTTAGTGLTSNRINSISYSQVRNNLAVATDDAGIFGFLEETPAVITITSPIGGEEWEGGSSHNITWITDGVCDHVNIDLSIDGGVTFNQNVVTQLADAGSYTWDPIASVNTNQARARVECKDIMENILASDISTDDFVIDSTKPTVSLNAISNPNGDNVIYGRGIARDTGGATSVSQVQYKVDTDDWNTALITVNPGTTNIEYDFSTTAIGGGEHTIYVRAKDSSLPGGNETDQTITASRSFNVDELSVDFSKTSFDANLDVGGTGAFYDSMTVTVTGFGTAYNIGIKANNLPTHNIYDSETIPFYTGNDNWSGNAKGFGWRYAGYNNGYYNAFPLSDYDIFYTGKANTNGVPTQIDFKAVADWTVDAGTYNSSVSVIVTPRY